VPSTLSLFKAGILRNVSDCYVTSSKVQTLPELHGTMQIKHDAPKFYVLDDTIVSDYEVQQLQSITPAEIQQLRDINTQMTTLQQTLDMYTLLHVHQTASLQQRQTLWFTTMTASVCAITVITILCLLFYFRSRNTPSTPSELDTAPHTSTCLQGEIEPKNRDTEPRVVFTAHPMQPSA
jgi:hypothetical protein